MESIAAVSTIIMTITAFQIDTPRYAFAAASNNQTSPPSMVMNPQTSNKTFYIFTKVAGFRETEGVVYPSFALVYPIHTLVLVFDLV